MEQRLNMRDLDHTTDMLMEKFDDWRSFIKIEDLPMNFDRAAIITILKESNRIAFKLFKKAVGAAYINEHLYVRLEDAALAIQVYETGTDLQDQLNINV